jgi:hypothetical protein
VGGLTKARMVRDLAVSAGIAMNIEDTWGGDIVTAAIAALAHSTPPDFLFCRYRTWNIAGNLESCFSYFCATSVCFSIVGWVYSCVLPILASD